MHKGYLTKAAGCKRLLRITTNAVETHENIGICGVTELAAYGPAYQCALRNYGKQNPAYDSLPNGYVPFENVYIKYRTDTDSWRLNALVYEEVRAYGNEARCLTAPCACGITSAVAVTCTTPGSLDSLSYTRW